MFNKNKIPKEALAKIVEVYEQAAKQQAKYDLLVEQPLKYEFLEQMINNATQGVMMEVTMTDGTKIKIKPMTQFDAYADGKDY